MQHKGTVVLETERLILRPFTEDDAQAVFVGWASDSEVTKYLTWPTHRTVNDSLGFMRYCVQSYQDKTSYQWGMERRDTHELIGNISVVHINEGIAEMGLGWVLSRKYWGQGYMPEAAKKVIDFLFDEVAVNRIFATHDARNLKSGRVMQKVGMKYEGTLRQSTRNNQGIVDLSHYAILRSDRETL